MRSWSQQPSLQSMQGRVTCQHSKSLHSILRRRMKPEQLMNFEQSMNLGRLMNFEQLMSSEHSLNLKQPRNC